MTSLKPGAAPTPEGGRPIDTPPPSNAGRRRIVRLASLSELDDKPAAPTATGGGAHRRARALPSSRDDWLVLAERMVGDWAATLRAALLLALSVASVIMVVGLTFGLGAALATTFIVLLIFLVGRRRDSVRR